MRDLFVVLVSDCAAGATEAAHRAALDNLGTFFCQVVDAAAVMVVWRTPGLGAEPPAAGVGAR